MTDEQYKIAMGIPIPKRYPTTEVMWLEQEMAELLTYLRKLNATGRYQYTMPDTVRLYRNGQDWGNWWFPASQPLAPISFFPSLTLWADSTMDMRIQFDLDLVAIGLDPAGNVCIHIVE